MQEVADWGDDVLTNPGDAAVAFDNRDGKQYWVTRLADGHIWMTQNLDLDLDPAKPLTSNDTDLTDHSLTGAYRDGYSYDANTGITTWIPERKTIDFQNTTVTGWGSSANKTDSVETGHMSLGNYYNWNVAIASNNSSSLVQNTLDNISNNPKNSICPKGWRLPTISSEPASVPGSTNEFARLVYVYNDLTSSPVYLQKAGNIYAGTLDNLGGNGFYYSSTVNTDGKAYEYMVSSGTASHPRSLGFSIRCVAK